MIDSAAVLRDKQVAEALLACPINCPVDLELLASPHTYRLRSRLVGIDVGHFLLLRYGTDQNWLDARNNLTQGQPVILRMVNEIGQCQLLAFHSTICVSPNLPRKLLTIQYPAKIESANMRRQRRIRVSFKCYIEWSKQGLRITEGTIVDLSAQGCRITTTQSSPIEKGTAITIRFKGEFSQLVIPGVVRNHARSTTGKTEHGVQFIDMDIEMRSRLSDLMLASF